MVVPLKIPIDYQGKHFIFQIIKIQNPPELTMYP